MQIRETLMQLPKGSILSLFGDLNGTGKAGFDHERARKADCVDKLIEEFGVVRVAEALKRQPATDYAGEPSFELTPPPAAPKPATSAPDVNALSQQIAGLFATLATSAVNEDRVREIVNSALEASPRVVIDVKRPDGTTYTPSGHVRPEFAAVLADAADGLNISLVGAAGCGKTHFAHQIAEALGREFASISCTAGMSESEIKGWLLPIGENGKFEYLESDFVRLYENGGVFLFDEIDAADSNTLLFINQALANGGFNLPIRRGATRVKRHPDFVCIGAANTYGTGANMTYAGRERLDESTIDRFRAATYELDYDTAFEQAAVEPSLLAWGWHVRDRIKACKLSRVMSTRFLLDATKQMKRGKSLDAIKATFFTGWKADERSKVEG